MLLLFFMRKRTQFLNSSIIFNDVNQTYIHHKIEVCYVGVVSTLIYHYILNKQNISVGFVYMLKASSIPHH